MRKKGKRKPTLKVSLRVWSGAVSQKQTGGVNYYFLLLTQDPRDLSRTSALLQLQGKDVVMAMKVDQDPLAVVHTLAEKFERVSAVPKVSTNSEVPIYYLRNKKMTHRYSFKTFTVVPKSIWTIKGCLK